MRIKLKKGYQQKLILESKNNQSWAEFAKKIGLNSTYLRVELANEKRLLSEEIYKKLCAISNENYNLLILEKLPDNWGRIKGGKNSLRKEKILIHEKSKELAELVGIILGDGNIWVKKGYYYLTIVGNEKKDSEYLLNYVRPLFKEIFKLDLHVRRHKTNNELFLYIGNKDVVFNLINLGLKSGDKQKNNVKIPDWVFESKEYLQSCVRGLFDTDGFVCPITGRNYPYIWFTSDIPNLRKSFDSAMKELGIKNSKWNIRKNRTPDTFIGSKEMIRKYMQTISFKNKRNLDKMTPL